MKIQKNFEQKNWLSHVSYCEVHVQKKHQGIDWEPNIPLLIYYTDGIAILGGGAVITLIKSTKKVRLVINKSKKCVQPEIDPKNATHSRIKG